MACAFGMEACKQYFNTRYVRLPDLLIDLEMARSDGSYKKTMAKYANPLVLILDEWLLLKPTDVGRILRTFKIKKECGGNRQWQRRFLRNWAANTKGKVTI